jgi:hypothetical protein
LVAVDAARRFGRKMQSTASLRQLSAENQIAVGLRMTWSEIVESMYPRELATMAVAHFDRSLTRNLLNQSMFFTIHVVIRDS